MTENNRHGSGVKQRYEYETVKIGSRNKAAAEKIDNHAAEGWRLVETIDVGGSSDYLVFERPVGDDQ